MVLDALLSIMIRIFLQLVKRELNPIFKCTKWLKMNLKFKEYSGEELKVVKTV